MPYGEAVPCLHGVLTIKRRLIIGTLIAYTVAAAGTVISVPTVAFELNTDVQIQTVEAHEHSRIVKGASFTNDHLSTEEKVRDYFDDIPIMAEVAKCESRFNHINPATGYVLRGIINPKDVGVMQINEYYHDNTAQKLGLELSNLEDNLAYARYLYEKEGTRPWNASRACWQNNLLAMR